MWNLIESSLWVETRTWFEGDSAIFHYSSTAEENWGMKKMYPEGNQCNPPIIHKRIQIIIQQSPSLWLEVDMDNMNRVRVLKRVVKLIKRLNHIFI